MLSPVVVFAYNRSHHLRNTLDALNRNELAEDTELFVFVDGAKNEQEREKVNDVQNILDEFGRKSRFRRIEVTTSDINKGLANSVISGVTRILENYESVIVVEDDIVTAPDFLRYMNDCLTFYRTDTRVGAISAYTPDFKMPSAYRHDLFLSKRGNSWGWATWREIWQNTDWDVSDFTAFCNDRRRKRKFARTQFRAVEMLYEQMQGKIDSWAIRWDYSFFVRGLYTVYPVKTKIINIGCDGSGTHGVNEKPKNMKLAASHYTLERLEADVRMIRLSSKNRNCKFRLKQRLRWQ
ncbi:MAG: glycosyltransferase [Clostridium sp.]|nr:glycosyltransferase [Clostridium sp.]